MHQTPEEIETLEREHKPGWPVPRIVYSRHYNFGISGFVQLHPFDSRKYARAWKELKRRFGRDLERFRVTPERPVSDRELLEVHTEKYLENLRKPAFIAGVVELPVLRYLPRWLVERLVLRPMRWATMGSIVAAHEAMAHGLAVNLSGGYHHATPDDGHGFCAYTDVGLATLELVRSGHLGAQDRIVYVDLDAHQGNGVCRTFFENRRVFIYDQYNPHVFPGDALAQRRIDCDVPVESGCGDAEYLRALREHLPVFLDSVVRRGPVRLAIYNAGTDIHAADQLGGMAVSSEGVLERDRLVLEELIGRGIPTMVLLSGGYGRESYRLVARMVGFILEKWGGCGA